MTRLWVPGHPKTKGSLTFVDQHFAQENVTGSVRWRMLVADAVRRHRGGRPPSLAPVSVDLCAFLALPGAGPHPSSAPLHRGAGDVDKLARNVLDALGVSASDPRKGAGAYADDNQVVALRVRKLYVGPYWSTPGMVIEVADMTPPELTDMTWTTVLNARDIMAGG